MGCTEHTDNDTAPDGTGAPPLTNDLVYRDTVTGFTPGALSSTPYGDRAALESWGHAKTARMC